MRRLWLFVILLFAAVAGALAVIEARLIGYPGRPSFTRTGSLFALVIAAILIARFVIFFVGMIRRGERAPIKALLSAIRSGAPSFGFTLAGAAALTLFLVSMGWIKSMLPFAVPFWADHALSRLDVLLWEGVPRFPLQAPQSLAYGFWQAAHLGTILWALHWKEGPSKDRVLISLLFTWTLGMALAYAVSSAGPIFTGFATGDPLARMEARYLWANYQSHGAVIGGGISAFPSMHVALALWVAFALRERGLSWIGAPFVLLVSMGAVTLGWHYSADVIGGLSVGIIGYGLSAILIRPAVEAPASVTEVAPTEPAAAFPPEEHPTAPPPLPL